MAAILTYGTSTTLGMYDYERGGWVNQLQAHYMARPFGDEILFPMNRAIPGTTSYDVAAELPHDVQTVRNRFCGRVLAMMQIGPSDGCWNADFTDWHVPPNEFEENLGEIAEIGDKILTMPPIFVTMQPYIAENAAMLESDAIEGFRLEGRRIYNGIIRSFCIENGLPLVDVEAMFDRTLRQPDAPLLHDEDGMHPNTYGHQLIAREAQVVIDGLYEKYLRSKAE